MQERKLTDLFAVLMQQMIDNIDHDSHKDKLFQKMVKSERLNPDEAKKLWIILHWRDQLAQSRNKPRNWILNPKQMVDIIRKVKTFSDLFQLGLHPNFVKLNGQDLVNTLFDDASCLSSLPEPVKLSSQQGKQFNDMKQKLKQVCDDYKIEPSIIINTQALKQLAFEGKDLGSLATWQALL